MPTLLARVLIGALLVSWIAPALAQSSSNVRVRGTVASATTTELVVNDASGASTRIALPAGVRISYVVKASLADLRPGGYVGTAAEPQADGSLKARELQIFPPGQTPAPGSRPYDLTPTSTMTNGHVASMDAAKVDNVDARVLTVTYDGGEKKVIVPVDVPVVTFAPADATALKAGAHVIVLATRNEDGTVRAVVVQVGKDGLVPPM